MRLLMAACGLLCVVGAGAQLSVTATATVCATNEANTSVKCDLSIEVVQSAPKPPVLQVPTPVPGNIIFRETFTGLPPGGGTSEYTIAGKWNTSQDPNGSVTIQSGNPVRPGFGSYMRPRLVKSGTNDFRAEYSNVAAPGGEAGGRLVVSGDNAWSNEDHWYGYVVCIDRFDQPNTGSVVTHLNQWHEWGDGRWNPLISLMGNLNGLQVYMERNEEGGSSTAPGLTVRSPILYDPAAGECFDVVWQFRADSRRANEGSQGLLRIWIGNDPTPKWQWVNKATTHKLSHGGENVRPYNKIGTYPSAWGEAGQGGEDGDTYEGRVDNYTVMDSSGSFAAMIAALNRPD